MNKNVKYVFFAKKIFDLCFEKVFEKNFFETFSAIQKINFYGNHFATSVRLLSFKSFVLFLFFPTKSVFHNLFCFAFHGYGQPKFAYGGLVLGLSQQSISSNLNARIFRTNFSPKPKRNQKSCQNVTFVRKTRAFNVDEIDTSFHNCPGCFKKRRSI